MCLGAVFGGWGWGGVLGGCFQINVGVLGGDFSCVRDFFAPSGVRDFLFLSPSSLRDFFPKRCSRLRLLPVRALGGGRRFWGDDNDV